MYARIRTTGSNGGDVLRVPQPRQSRFDISLNGPHFRLPRKPVKGPTVIGEIDSKVGQWLVASSPGGPSCTAALARICTGVTRFGLVRLGSGLRLGGSFLALRARWPLRARRRPLSTGENMFVLRQVSALRAAPPRTPQSPTCLRLSAGRAGGSRIDKLDQRHRSPIASTGADLQYACIAAVSRREAPRDVVEEFVGDLAIPNMGEHLASMMHGTFLGLGNETLRVRPQELRFRLSSLYSLVLE
jgi:hypothetical protein